MARAEAPRPFTLLIKPVGSRCNLDCRYCFYLGNDDLLAGPRPAVMPEEVLERMVRDYLGYGFPTSAFTWQGGEPTLAGLEFYRRAVELQLKYGRGGQLVANALQTNGTLLNEDWCRFLAEYRFLVGLSLDGPEEVHDHYRRDRQDGPTFAKVIAAAELMTRHGVEFNILSMITARSQHRGAEVYRWLVAQGFRHLQFIPCVEYDSATGAPRPENPTPEGFGRFHSDVFDEWYYGGEVGRVSLRTEDGIVGRLSGLSPLSICNLGERCDHYLVVEKDGGVYPCDFFVQDRWRLGSLMETPLAELFRSGRAQSFAALKRDWPERCRLCPHLDLCHGGCPKDRLAVAAGRLGRASYLCDGLRAYFDHTRARLEALTEEVRQRHAPRNPVAAASPGGEPGRNEPCPCGSGRKYKQCCLRK